MAVCSLNKSLLRSNVCGYQSFNLSLEAFRDINKNEIAYLSKEEQEWVLQCVVGRAASVSGTMADQLKKHSEEGKLTELAVCYSSHYP